MTQKKQITIERTYRAHLDDMWDMWTTKEGIESWWGPGGFFVKVQRIELRVGGALEYEMTTQDPAEIEAAAAGGVAASVKIHATYSEIEPKTRLAYVTHTDFVQGVPPEDITTRIELHPQGERIRMVLTADVMNDPHMTRMMEMGWKMEFEKLAKLLEGSP